jgi:16S rRNA (guanine1207-N2)-methyltransferase
VTEHYFTTNADLKSETRLIQYNYGDGVINFTSDLGVFSKNKLDYGSRLLIETYIEKGRDNIDLLDVGCGYGFIGLSLARIKNTNSTMVDVNKRAVHLTNMNIKNNKIKNAVAFESNIYESVEGLYDVVITNPPIRTGRETVLTFLRDSKKYLKPNGELWFVMRKDQGALTVAKKLEDIYKIEIIAKSKGFLIFRGI